MSQDQRQILLYLFVPWNGLFRGGGGEDRAKNIVLLREELESYSYGIFGMRRRGV